jgi:hypothetical protein
MSTNNAVTLDSIFALFELKFHAEFQSMTLTAGEQALEKKIMDQIVSFVDDEIIKNYTNIDYLVVSESLGYNMIMVMHEPAVDSGRQDELDRWTRWFDQVRDCSDAIKNILLSTKELNMR